MWLSPEMSRSAMGPSLVWVARSLGGLGDGVKVLAERNRALEGSPSLSRPPEPFEQVAAEGPVRLVAGHVLGRHPVERGEPGLGATSLTERGGVANAGAGGGREPEQPLVQQRYRFPVGALRNGATGVHRLNGGLELEPARSLRRRGAGQRRLRLVDHRV